MQVSNITDHAYLGTAKTLCYLGSLLREVEINAHATLIGLYLNAVAEMSKDVKDKNEMRRAMEYLGRPTDISPRSVNMMIYKAGAATEHVRNGDNYFDQ